VKVPVLFHPIQMERLWQYPYIIVRIACRVCRRQGQYRLARLAERYGADSSLDDLLEQLAKDCPWRDPKVRRKAKGGEGCGAHFPDLRDPTPPPDLPPAPGRVRVIEGGRSNRPDNRGTTNGRRSGSG